MDGPCISSYLTLIGTVSVTEDGNGMITGVYLPCSNLPAMDDFETEALARAGAQIDEYLSGKRKGFDLPLRYDCSGFKADVLEAIRRIPYGEVRTYKQVAEDSGHPGAYRAVGTVCADNPLPIVIPCHRVVPASGGIGTYSGGVLLKKRLLDLEKP